MQMTTVQIKKTKPDLSVLSRWQPSTGKNDFNWFTRNNKCSNMNWLPFISPKRADFKLTFTWPNAVWTTEWFTSSIIPRDMYVRAHPKNAGNVWLAPGGLDPKQAPKPEIELVRSDMTPFGLVRFGSLNTTELPSVSSCTYRSPTLSKGFDSCCCNKGGTGVRVIATRTTVYMIEYVCVVTNVSQSFRKNNRGTSKICSVYKLGWYNCCGTSSLKKETRRQSGNKKHDDKITIHLHVV